MPRRTLQRPPCLPRSRGTRTNLLVLWTMSHTVCNPCRMDTGYRPSPFVRFTAYFLQAFVTLAILIGVTAFALDALDVRIGPLGSPAEAKPDPRIAQCRPIHESYQRHTAAVTSAEHMAKAVETGYDDRMAATHRWRTELGLVVALIQQNPECFSPEDRAGAQVTRDMLSR